MSLTVRNVEAADVAKVAELMHKYIVGFYSNPWPGDDNIDELIQTLLKKEEGIQFVAEKDGELIGFSTLYFSRSTMKAQKITVMNDFFVLEPYLNTKVESLLFMTCQKYTQDLGFSHMSWITSVENKRAQQFFDQAGAVQGNWLSYSIV
ncbi:GNAT family N-acetyltransferase [Paenibacillus sp. OV219]|uniref:GNAT family N-acetyltransferase n=1 Tax=Paenibacillus sp. OV219 TaxID=1884377 RepID=UPI0008C43B50|nr:GNAT family N-acetyltransferase [Paenibacillus sp. OV219]SEP13633.1 Acetyltransferase (GNAT) family protein [Paenibacillus sp. OV219]